jgi:hypothetical protein
MCVHSKKQIHPQEQWMGVKTKLKMWKEIQELQTNVTINTSKITIPLPIYSMH